MTRTDRTPETLFEIPADRVSLTRDGSYVRLEVSSNDTLLMALTFDEGLLRVAGSQILSERYPLLAPFLRT